jgi:hypothetical protein
MEKKLYVQPMVEVECFKSFELMWSSEPGDYFKEDTLL